MGNISNFQFKNLEARRLQRPESRSVQVRIDNNLSITQVRTSATETCQVEFNYTAAYGALGFIRIEGEFTYAGPQAAQCAKDWESKRNMPGEAASEIHTGIMHACIPEAVTLARTIQLPPPIPLPTVKFEKPAGAPAPPTSAIGGNPEFA